MSASMSFLIHKSDDVTSLFKMVFGIQVKQSIHWAIFTELTLCVQEWKSEMSQQIQSAYKLQRGIIIYGTDSAEQGYLTSGWGKLLEKGSQKTEE